MNNNDKPVVYILGSDMLESELTNYKEELDKVITDNALVNFLNINSEDGTQVSERYEVEEEKLPAIILVEDDETFYKAWYGQDLPDPEMVKYEVSQITGS